MKKITDIKTTSEEVKDDLNFEVTKGVVASPDGGTTYEECQFGTCPDHDLCSYGTCTFTNCGNMCGEKDGIACGTVKTVDNCGSTKAPITCTTPVQDRTCIKLFYPCNK